MHCSVGLTDSEVVKSEECDFYNNYRSCKVDNMVVKPGDHILVNNGDDDPYSAYVAKIIKLYDTGKHCSNLLRYT